MQANNLSSCIITNNIDESKRFKNQGTEYELIANWKNGTGTILRKLGQVQF
ncbi:MAG: hypothetical protein RBR23_10915 [Arcobacteraceae bacterium]|jgi:hypothetical protein|nr:hypothetical protein [Arcobacteraceae bacterium]